jgi:hypothetical protein
MNVQDHIIDHTDHAASAWAAVETPQRERLGAALGRLLGRGSAVREQVGEPAGDFRLLDRYEEAAREYLRPLGWDLRIDRAAGFANAFRPDGGCRVYFNKDETILACLLRLLWQERAGRAAWEDGVFVTVADLDDAHVAHTRDDRPPSRRRLARTLRRLDRLNLITLPRPFEPSPDAPIEILPTLTAAIPDEAIRRALERLRAANDSAE